MGFPPNLYNQLLDAQNQKIDSDTELSSLFLDLMTFVKPYVIHRTHVAFLENNQYKFTNKGLLLMNDTSANAVSSTDLDTEKKRLNIISGTYKNELIKFLQKYNLTSGKADDNTTTDVTGVFLGKTYRSRQSVPSTENVFLSNTDKDTFTTGATLNDKIAYFNTNTVLSAFTLDLSNFSTGGGAVTGDYLPLSGGTVEGDVEISGLTKTHQVQFPDPSGNFGTNNSSQVYNSGQQLYLRTGDDSAGALVNIGSLQSQDGLGYIGWRNRAYFNSPQAGIIQASDWFTGDPTKLITGEISAVTDNNLVITQKTNGVLNGLSIKGSADYGSPEAAVFKLNFQSGEVRIGAVATGGYYPTFYSNGTEAMRLSPNGNLLVGTTIDTGLYKMQVVGAADFNNFISFAGKANNVTFGDLTGADYTDLYGTETKFSNGSKFAVVQANNVGSNDIFFQTNQTDLSGYGILEAYSGQGLVLQTGGNNGTPIIFRPNRTEQMRLFPNGNLALGTATDDGTRFHVYSNVDGGSSMKFENASNGSSAWAGVQLQADSQAGYIYMTSSNYNPAYVTPNTLVLQNTGGDIGFFPSNVEKMRITESGHVGIGTDSPAELLHVAGNAQVDGELHVYSDINTDGAVNVATDLHVTGNIYAGGSSIMLVDSIDSINHTITITIDGTPFTIPFNP